MGIGIDLAGIGRRARRPFAVAACALALAGCATAPRVPYTQQEQAEAVIPGIPGARLWADDPAIAAGRRSVVSRAARVPPTILALSGGGADGAFGEMSNLLQSDAFSALFGASIFKSAPLRDLIARHVDAALLQAIAREHRT